MSCYDYLDRPHRVRKGDKSYLFVSRYDDDPTGPMEYWDIGTFITFGSMSSILGHGCADMEKYFDNLFLEEILFSPFNLHVLWDYLVDVNSPSRFLITPVPEKWDYESGVGFATEEDRKPGCRFDFCKKTRKEFDYGFPEHELDKRTFLFGIPSKQSFFTEDYITNTIHDYLYTDDLCELVARVPDLLVVPARTCSFTSLATPWQIEIVDRVVDANVYFFIKKEEAIQKLYKEGEDTSDWRKRAKDRVKQLVKDINDWMEGDIYECYIADEDKLAKFMESTPVSMRTPQLLTQAIRNSVNECCGGFYDEESMLSFVSEYGDLDTVEEIKNW